MHEYRDLMAQQRTKEVRTMACGVVVFIVLCIGVGLIAGTLLPPGAELAPTATLPNTIAPATRTAMLASTPTSVAMPTGTPVLADTPVPEDTPVSEDTPVPTDTPVPEDTPTPTETSLPTATSTSTATPSPEPVSIPAADSRADVVSYEGLVPVEGVPDGVDIRAASVDADLRVALQTTGGVPAELSGWAEDEVLLWIALYDPIPDPPAVYTEWVFALDLDGDVGTGRPAGSLRINPDIGVEVAVGVYYDPDSGGYELYSLVWDPAQGGWADGPGGMHFVLSESRTLVGLALPLETLTQSAAQVTGVTVVPGAARGRAAALATVEGQRIIDFYPDRPD